MAAPERGADREATAPHDPPGPARPRHAEEQHRETAAERRARYDADEVHSLRERVAETRWRRRLAARRSVDHTYRTAVGAVGGLVVAFGLVTIPLPGPGWLTVIAGLFVLATEFTWAERLLEFTKRHVHSWGEWLRRQRMWVRVLVSLATAAFVYGVLVVTLHLTGVPDWVPGWVPLWR
ncbi:TIGR02611 family protein [Geodermatophilus sp. YIM 151500]|uniref:TIGR02611 family protein n=1 Tax=Geodermatophilus sp. YIM 151500 TaxID=2984531 RepID=UPI0021E4E116|nr:TIGR02611 family protein [Geodermatophilus sp. YIM 151500]MCV2491419.1 TIGR02611 family protein [Geodermatophilus sp. YIM 151500]